MTNEQVYDLYEEKFEAELNKFIDAVEERSDLTLDQALGCIEMGRDRLHQIAQSYKEDLAQGG